MRVVSLVPSVTETLLAWGVEPVGVTRFCEQPALTAVGGTKNPDVEVIAALEPDVVVMNDEENRRVDYDALVARGLDVRVVTVDSVEDVVPALAALAARVDVNPAVDAVDVVEPLGVRAFVPIWRRPWMTMNAQTYGSSLLNAIGVDNVFAGASERYPAVTLEEAAALGPDVVLAPSEPYEFTERHVPELSEVAPVELVDGRDLFWWGVRTAAAARRLRERLLAVAR